jgi:6-phosphogluconolactonase
MMGEKDPAEAANEYNQLLNDKYARGLDLVLLGMGEDGHTASLFPDTEALQVKDRLCVANFVPKFNSWRLTMTAPYLNRAFETLVLLAGKAKAQVANRVLEGASLPMQYPIQLIQPATGKLVWMMDAQAAGMDEDEPTDEANGGLADEDESSPD